MNQQLVQASQNLTDQLASLRVLMKASFQPDATMAQLDEIDTTAEALHTMHLQEDENPIELFPHLSDEDIRGMAQEKWAEDGECEIDVGAVVSRSEDGGAYVAAWVWVSLDDPAKEDTEEEDA